MGKRLAEALQCEFLGTHAACGFGATSTSSSEASFEVAFAPNCALKGKLAEKHGENRRKSGGERRKMALFRAPKAPFRGAPSRLPSIATGPFARPYVHGVRPPRAAYGPPSRQWGAIFRGPGHETTYVGRVNLTIAPILSRALEQCLLILILLFL
jgi:hypothetical protein